MTQTLLRLRFEGGVVHEHGPGRVDEPAVESDDDAAGELLVGFEDNLGVFPAPVGPCRPGMVRPGQICAAGLPESYSWHAAENPLSPPGPYSDQVPNLPGMVSATTSRQVGSRHPFAPLSGGRSVHIVAAPEV